MKESVLPPYRVSSARARSASSASACTAERRSATSSAHSETSQNTRPQ